MYDVKIDFYLKAVNVLRVINDTIEKGVKFIF